MHVPPTHLDGQAWYGYLNFESQNIPYTSPLRFDVACIITRSVLTNLYMYIHIYLPYINNQSITVTGTSCSLSIDNERHRITMIT